MRRLKLWVLAAGLLIAADAPTSDDDRLQGTWYIVHLDQPGARGGREVHDFADDKFSLSFDHGRVISTGEGKLLWQGTYVLDPAKNPPAIDITRRAGPFKRGIYQIEGDNLKLCLDYPDNQRPTRFNLRRDSSAQLMVFRHEKPAP